MLEVYPIHVAGKVKAIEKKSFTAKDTGNQIDWTEIYLENPKSKVLAQVNVSKNFKLPKVGDDVNIMAFPRKKQNQVSKEWETTYKAIEEQV